MTRHLPTSKRCKSRAERKRFNAQRGNIVACNLASAIESYLEKPVGVGNLLSVGFSVGLARACLKQHSSRIGRAQRRRLQRVLDRFDAALPEHEVANRLLWEPYVVTGIDWGVDSKFGTGFGTSLGRSPRINAASVADQIDKHLQGQGIDARVAVSPASYGNLTITAQVKVDKPADFICFLYGPGDLNEPQAQ